MQSRPGKSATISRGDFINPATLSSADCVRITRYPTPYYYCTTKVHNSASRKRPYPTNGTAKNTCFIGCYPNDTKIFYTFRSATSSYNTHILVTKALPTSCIQKSINAVALLRGQPHSEKSPQPHFFSHTQKFVPLTTFSQPSPGASPPMSYRGPNCCRGKTNR
jgi:hypothetical protein